MKNNIKQILLFNFFHSELFEKLSLSSVDCHLLISSQKACRVQHFVISHHHHPKVRIAFDKSKSTLPGGGSWPVKAFLIDFAWIVCCEPADEGGVCYEYRARCDGGTYWSLFGSVSHDEFGQLRTISNKYFAHLLFQSDHRMYKSCPNVEYLL